MYVYIQTEPKLWTVGFYGPDGEWHNDSDYGYSDREEAAERVAYLNGVHSSLVERIERLEQRVEELENHEVSPYEAAMIMERANER